MSTIPFDLSGPRQGRWRRRRHEHGPSARNPSARSRPAGNPSARSRPARVALALTAALLGIALTLPASANADVGMKIILDCTHHRSIAGFTQQDYRKALQDMPTDVSEYGDCWELIQQAEIAAARRGRSPGGSGSGGGKPGGGAQGGGQSGGGAGGAGGTGGSGGGPGATAGTGGAEGSGGAGEGLTNEPIAQSPAEKQAVAAAQSGGGAPLKLGGEVIHPGVVHANLASAASTLPAPLIALLALLLACGAAIGGKAVWDRLRRDGEGG